MKNKPKPGDLSLIQLARTSGNDEDEMQLNIVCGDTYVRLALSMLNFAELMSGTAHVEARVIRWETRKPETK